MNQQKQKGDNMPNIYWILGIFTFGLTVGWTSHTWYDGYSKTNATEKLISDRVDNEKSSNNDAARTAIKENEDGKKSAESDAAVEKHIKSNVSGFKCAVPDVGVRDLRQTVTSHTRARKPD